MSPLDMPTRRPVTQTQSATVRYSTSTGQAASDREIAAQARDERAAQWILDRTGCPGCDGETSSAIGASLGCTHCAE